MLKKQIVHICLLVVLGSVFGASARDVLLEFKAAGFFPTDCTFKNIYGKSGALYGPELTVQLCDDNEHWYAFAGVDHYSEKGCSIGLKTPTEVSLLFLSLGLKYLVPFCFGDFYVGLGAQPVRLETINCSLNVAQHTSKWDLGGIVKVGSYFDIGCNWFLDVFLHYSFAKVCSKVECPSLQPIVTPVKADVSGVAVGAGLGYRF